MTRLALIVAGVTVPFSLAQGQFVLTEDLRDVTVSVEIMLTDPDDGKTQHFFDDFDNVTPFEPFGLFQTITLVHAEESPINFGLCLGEHSSTCSGTLLAADGSISAEGQLGFAIPPSFLNSAGISLYKVRFDVAEPTLVRMEAEMNTISPAQGSGTNGTARARLTRTDTSQTVLSLTVQGVAADSIDETVLLDPGSYEQEFFAQAGASTSSGDVGPSSAWYSGSLTVLDQPCNAADLVAPFGVLDLADIQAFISAFINLDPAADIAEPFGVWDLVDVQLFIVEFAVAGCP